jgi:hypothetical protein
MNNDAEAREVHGTVTDSEESGRPVNGYQDEPVSDDQNEPVDRPGLAGEDDGLIDPDAVVIAKDSDDADDLDEADLDEADDDTHPDTVASAIVVEPVAADDGLEPLPGDDTVADPVSADGTVADPVTADGTVADPVTADGTVADPVSADDTVVDPVSADDTVVDPDSADGTLAEPVPAAEPIPASTATGPKHAAADSAAVRPGMPVNGDVPEGSPMVGDPQQLHERWATIQSAFVDDPHGSVTSAADMVTEVIATVVASAKERESGLRGEWDRDGVDTEDLRNALRSYRALLDHLAAL